MRIDDDVLNLHLCGVSNDDDDQKVNDRRKITMASICGILCVRSLNNQKVYSSERVVLLFFFVLCSLFTIATPIE